MCEALRFLEVRFTDHVLRSPTRHERIGAQGNAERKPEEQNNLPTGTCITKSVLTAGTPETDA